MTAYKNSLKVLLAASCAAAAISFASTSVSAQDRTHHYAITQQDLGSALRSFALRSGRDVAFEPALVRGKTTPGIEGDMTDEEALRRLLAGTGLSFFVTTAGGFVVTPLASTAEGDDTAVVEEVIVTASKRAERLVDVPMSIVALGAQQLEERNVTSLLDITRLAPGLAMQDQGPGQRRIFMRGLGNVFGNSTLVGLYLDEASVSSIQDAEIDLRPYDLERVEVLRGPQGTLYGEGSTSGTIRFITASPDLAAVGGHAKASASSTENGGVGAEFVGALNLPVVTDTFGLRLSGQVVNSSGWIDQPAQGRKDINDQKLWDLRLIGLYRPSDDFQVRIMGVVHRNDAGAQNTVTDRTNTFVQVLGETASPTSQDDYDFANATLTWRLGDIQLLSSTTHLDVVKNLYNQGSAGQTAPPPAAKLEVFGNRYRKAHVFSQEFRVSSTTDRLSWLVGAYYRDGKSEYAQTLKAGFGTPFLFFSTGSVTRSRAGSVFGNVDYELTDQLAVGGGVRYFRDERETFNGATKLEGSFESVSPRLYVKYALPGDANVYASVAKGFRSGGFNAAPPNYGPETAWTYELGYKANALGGRLAAEVTLFHTDYTDVQVYTIVDFVTLAARYTNAGNARVDGIEVSLSGQVTEQLELGFSGSYVHSEFESIRVGSTHAVGDGLDYVPDYNVVLWGGYEFTLPTGQAAAARVDFSVQGPAVYRNRTLGTFYYSESDVVQLLNASLEADFGPWRAEIFASNLLNDDGFRDPASINGDATVNRPRTFGLSLSRKF